MEPRRRGWLKHGNPPGDLSDVRRCGAQTADDGCARYGDEVSGGRDPRRSDTDGDRRNVHRATWLMRLFAEQLEALAKLKGKSSQQRVAVEHVTVNEGGQAIVGAVAATKALPGGPVNE